MFVDYIYIDRMSAFSDLRYFCSLNLISIPHNFHASNISKTWLFSNQAAGSPSTARHCMLQLPTPSWCDWGWSPADRLQRSVDPGNRLLVKNLDVFFEFLFETGVENHHFCFFFGVVVPKFLEKSWKNCDMIGFFWKIWSWKSCHKWTQMDESATGYISAWIRSIKTSIGVDPGLQSATGVVWRSKRKNRDQDLNSPCLTRKAAQVLGFMAGLGHLDPEPFFVWHQDMVFFSDLRQPHWSKVWETHEGLAPTLRHTHIKNRAIFPKHHWKWLERPCQLPPWTACKRPSHLGQRDPGDFFIGTPSSFSYSKCHVSWEKLTKIRKQPWVWVPQF